MSTPTTLTLGNDDVTVERPTGLKASRALALMRKLTQAMPALQEELAAFRSSYERNNYVELDRVQAKLELPPRPVIMDGKVLLDDDGEPTLVPSPVDRITEADWEAAGGKYRRPASPSAAEVAVAMFDRALEVAEEHVYALLALFTIPNQELKTCRAAGTLDERLKQRADELLDNVYADELLELAVVIGETVDQHFRRKTTELGDRLGKALALVGLDRTPTRTSTASTSATSPSSLSPDSSTDSPAPTPAGPPTPSSEPPTTSSSSLEDSSKPRMTPEPEPAATPA